MTIWTNLALAMAAGALLNLTPCVLPVLPIKLRTIARAVGNGPRQRLIAAIALLAGTLTFFGALAVATAGLNWTWGTLFQAVWFRAALALLLAGLGVYSLVGRGVQPPQWVYRIRATGYAEPYMVGLLATVPSGQPVPGFRLLSTRGPVYIPNQAVILRLQQAANASETQ